MSTLFTAGFLFCGPGAGALGFLEAAAQLGAHGARFVSVGGIDIDEASCRDFEYLTKSKAVRADISKMTVAQLRAHWGPVAPKVVFLSPPCKGFSGLLSQEMSETEKYQDLNLLVPQGLFLVCEAWDTPPDMIVLENVPRIQTRGKELLSGMRQQLSHYGYVFSEATHDCGEIGGLAQHRRRYLLVARLKKKVPNFIYQPPKLKVRACGEVLSELPLPETIEAGELHRLPRLSWMNWIRLALIPAGGDHRDLPKGPVALEKTAENAGSFAGRPGLMGVIDWQEPAPTVTGSARVSSSNAPAAIADPRTFKESFSGTYGVAEWKEPMGTVTGAAKSSSGTFSIADPRLLSPLAEGERRGLAWAKYKIRKWTEPTGPITGPGSNGEYGIADPRIGGENTFGHVNKVTSWEEPTGTVTHSPAPSSGAIAVADPRLGENPNRHDHKYKVTPWQEPTGTVTGARPVTSGGPSVADPRLTCEPRSGTYGVLSWGSPSKTVTGAAAIDNGSFAIADPRKSPNEIPVIIADDGTWHRPLTTLELARLQGLPAMVDGKPLALHGKNSSKWRERIGNAVPVGAAKAIAESLLTALLVASLGTWTLGSTGIWVEKAARKKKRAIRRETELREAAE
jgi:site-specific DNA-cytosine methylase